jgi:hypothetical protein
VSVYITVPMMNPLSEVFFQNRQRNLISSNGFVKTPFTVRE